MYGTTIRIVLGQLMGLFLALFVMYCMCLNALHLLFIDELNVLIVNSSE